MSVETESQERAPGQTDGSLLLEVDHLKVLFPIKAGLLIARWVRSTRSTT